MKQSLSPTVAAIVILATIGLAALAWIAFARVPQEDSKASHQMPQEVQAEFQKRLGTGPAPQGAATGNGATPTVPPSGGTR